jgi:hypothetical protein
MAFNEIITGIITCLLILLGLAAVSVKFVAYADDKCLKDDIYEHATTGVLIVGVVLLTLVAARLDCGGIPLGHNHLMMKAILFILTVVFIVLNSIIIHKNNVNKCDTKTNAAPIALLVVSVILLAILAWKFLGSAVVTTS